MLISNASIFRADLYWNSVYSTDAVRLSMQASVSQKLHVRAALFLIARRKDENREYEFESCRDVVFLNQLKHAVESLALGFYCKVELIAGNVMSTLVRFIGWNFRWNSCSRRKETTNYGWTCMISCGKKHWNFTQSRFKNQLGHSFLSLSRLSQPKVNISWKWRKGLDTKWSNKNGELVFVRVVLWRFAAFASPIA